MRTSQLLVLLSSLGFTCAGLLAGGPDSDNRNTQDWARYETGPWGLLERKSILLDIPANRIPDEISASDGNTRWFVRSDVRQEIENLIKRTDLTEKERAQLWDSVEEHQKGIVLKPTDRFVLRLKPDLRKELYWTLASSPENADQNEPFVLRNEDLQNRCRQCGLSPSVSKLLTSLLYRIKGRILFSDARLLLRNIPDERTRHSLMKLLFQTQTYRVRLHIEEGANVGSIARYWDPDGDSEIAALLRAVSESESAPVLDVALILTPFAKSRLYRFARKSLSYRPRGPDCYWTAANFHRNQPDDAFFSPNLLWSYLETECNPVRDQPTYGDLVVLHNKESGAIVHAAVYLAADLFFSKNGSDRRIPWSFSTLADLKYLYGWKGALGVRFFRPKK